MRETLCPPLTKHGMVECRGAIGFCVRCGLCSLESWRKRNAGCTLKAAKNTYGIIVELFHITVQYSLYFCWYKEPQLTKYRFMSRDPAIYSTVLDNGVKMDFVDYLNKRLQAVGIDKCATREISSTLSVTSDDIIECGNQMKFMMDRNATVLSLSEVASAQRATR